MVSVYILLGLTILALALYTVIPDLFLHRLGIGSWKRQFTPGVALTFDDGPDPVITPKVLAILAKYQIPATFFIVGEKAAQYPELIRRIRANGHRLGAHCQTHRYAWFMSPWSTWREWEKSINILERITGEAVELVRPPWGTFNLVTWWWLKKRRKKAVLWNAEGHDWQVRRTPGEIAERLLKRTKEGTIIVLHDSGGEQGAPDNSLQALDLMCGRIVEELKLPLVPLEFPEWTEWHRFLFALWEKWELLFARLYRVERIDANNLFRLSLNSFEGPDLYAQDGRLLAKKGDTVAEIHLDNVRLQRKGSGMRELGLKALRQVRESLPGLAAYVAENPKYRSVEVFMGLTLLNRGVKGFGFHVQEIPLTGFTRFVGILQRVIMVIYHPAGKARLTERLGHEPKLVWISRQELLQRWLPQKK